MCEEEEEEEEERERKEEEEESRRRKEAAEDREIGQNPPQSSALELWKSRSAQADSRDVGR